LSIYFTKIDGQINDLRDIRDNQWISKNDKLFSIVNLDQHQVVAFVSENDLYKINKTMQAQFKPNNDEFLYIDLNLSSIDMSAIEYLPYLSLASVYGGSIPVRSLDDQNKLYKPEKAQYKITFIPENPMNSLQWQTPGKVKLLTNNHSFFSTIYNKLLKILIRESGF
jgi:putative peptide zinc metalloprotease protein